LASLAGGLSARRETLTAQEGAFLKP